MNGELVERVGANGELAPEEKKETKYILNFGHPLAQRVIDTLAPCEQIKVSLQLDLDNDATPPQVHRAVGKAFLMLEKNGVPLDGTKAIMVVLPGISEAAALLMAELHGRLGTFPNVLALRKVGDGTWGLAPQEGMYNGVLDLEKVRNAARERR